MRKQTWGGAKFLSTFVRKRGFDWSVLYRMRHIRCRPKRYGRPDQRAKAGAKESRGGRVSFPKVRHLK